MTTGSINKINLNTSSFERIITNGQFYVDKTRLIEHFLNSSCDVSLVTRQRRLGKSLNMDMLRSFLSDREDTRHLFKGLYIESSSVLEMINSAPVFYFDFKNLTPHVYETQITQQVDKHIFSIINPKELNGYCLRLYNNLMDNPKYASSALIILTEIAYETAGKRSYLLIDEYDKLLIDNHKNESYEEIRNFFTALFSSALKGNQYLEKAMLTGVLRISHESMFSGLNNIVTYDVFNDETYTDDYGFTEDEVEAINKYVEFDKSKLRQWYNGVRISGKPIYNTYSVMSYLFQNKFGCFWGKSGAMHIIAELLNENRKAALAKLLNNEQIEVPLASRVSLCDLSKESNDEAFYSLLVQGGYLSLIETVKDKPAAGIVSIPNIELMLVWKEFILEKVFHAIPRIRTIFDNINSPSDFENDLEYFLRDRLSFYDLAAEKGINPKSTQESLYHAFMLGILSAYENVNCGYPLSNRESGDGRYDILAIRPDVNIIFEFKACSKEEDMETNAEKALVQINTKRYGADLDKSKRLVKVGIAFCGKDCKVKVA